MNPHRSTTDTRNGHQTVLTLGTRRAVITWDRDALRASVECVEEGRTTAAFPRRGETKALRFAEAFLFGCC